MPNLGKKRVYQLVGGGLCVVVLGSGIAKALLDRQASNSARLFQVGTELQAGTVQVNDINILKALPPHKRTEKLTAIAQGKETIERSRARYLLASELLQQNQPQKALEQLDKLETSYPVMAPHVFLKRAQAHQQAGDATKAASTRQELVKQHPSDPTAAEALYELGKTNPAFWDQAIAQFPAHPRSVEIAQQRLQQNPNQPQLLLLIAKHGLYLENYTKILDRIVEQYKDQLRPEDWEAIAFGYWEKQEYGKAGEAYFKAPFTARNAYRTARGLQLGDKSGATQAYLRTIQSFPTDKDTGLALIRVSKLVDPQVSIGYLDQAISQFPDRAGEALLQKSKVLDELNNSQAATLARQTLLNRYGSSDAAAELRWDMAQKAVAAGDASTAITWAAPIPAQNPDSEYAPEAAFWVGKWSNQLGKLNEAKKAFETVLTRYPQSYYAWRSASMLGWDVGDFSTVRQLKPAVARPADRPDLPAGSATLQELYQLGQDQDAWKLWQTEFQNQMQPTVAEQFTDGLMRQSVGDTLDGIFMVSYLSQRDVPTEQDQYKALKRNIDYWYALYPFPYLEQIENWSQERQLNPLLVTALIRQESRFTPDIKSSAGAVGLMQVMPDTATWIAKNIKLKEYQLDKPEDNIKLGTWYLDYTHEEYANNSMLAVASYNAGPGAVGDWVAKKGVGDPDQFVESIPYSETRGYVKSVFENYWNYLRLYNPQISQKLAQVAKDHPTAQ